MITTEQIKELRDKTGISVMQCRKALEEAGGDMEKAMFFLRKQGAEIATKKAERTLKSGTIVAYVHASGSVGAMVEINCESDFVAKNPEFKQLGYDIAMHITAMNPKFLNASEITDDVRAEVAKLMEEEVNMQSADKPAEAKKKMIEGKVSGYFREKTLLEQTYIKDATLTIEGLIKSFIQKFGERIEIGAFKRMSVLEK